MANLNTAFRNYGKKHTETNASDARLSALRLLIRMNCPSGPGQPAY